MKLHLDVGWAAVIWRLNSAGCPGGSLTWLAVDTGYWLGVHLAMLTEAPTCSLCSFSMLLGMPTAWSLGLEKEHPRASIPKSRKPKSPEAKGYDKNRHSITSTTLCWSNDVTQPIQVREGEDTDSISWWGSGKLNCKRACRMEDIVYAVLGKHNLLQG